jgi:DNA (cytosine-5)-methyltransferase 1
VDRPLLLDLFCGAGGAAMGYHRAGFDVVGVDIKPQPCYPFPFIQANALSWGDVYAISGRGIAAIHASPPCQRFTAYRRRGAGVGDSHPDLIAPVRDMLLGTLLPYVIENVPGAPLFSPVQFCGSSFGLDVRRHRMFESNVPLTSLPCDHESQLPRFPGATNRTGLRDTVEIGVWRIPLTVQQKAMGIDWMNVKELSQAVPPAYTEHIGRALLDHLLMPSNPKEN